MKLLNFDKVLCLSPHPDDVELGLAGSIIKYYDTDFDIFLYKRIGKQMLRMVTSNIFIRPYASVSLREYFATGFEAYYMGNKDLLKQLSPVLYNKIERL